MLPILPPPRKQAWTSPLENGLHMGETQESSAFHQPTPRDVRKHSMKQQKRLPDPELTRDA